MTDFVIDGGTGCVFIAIVTNLLGSSSMLFHNFMAEFFNVPSCDAWGNDFIDL